MTININLQEISNITKAISDWEYLPNIFTQLGHKEQNQILKEFWDNNIVKRTTSTYFTTNEYNQWKEINLHTIQQMWGNTSGGWEGIGGSAMTKSYTIIIENKLFGISCVHYNGQLAYICLIDEKYLELIKEGYDRMPGVNSCESKLSVLYRKK